MSATRFAPGQLVNVLVGYCKWKPGFVIEEKEGNLSFSSINLNKETGFEPRLGEAAHASEIDTPHLKGMITKLRKKKASIDKVLAKLEEELDKRIHL
jgi:hypothetical protein